jgi:hypothetical protein
LVVSLSLMVLLTIVAVGLLTLSAGSLRSSTQGSVQAAARQNARLALILAIGDLQKHLGPDQRISANASSLNASSPQPNVMGAWDALGWQGPEGSPPRPDEKADRFRSWLVSARQPESAAEFDFQGSAPGADSILLVDPATTGTNDGVDTSLRAQRVPVTGSRGRGGLAWVVADNSTRAPLNIAPANTEQLAENLANRAAASAPRPEVLAKAIASIDRGKRARLLSLPTAELAIGRDHRIEVSARTQSLTTTSLGLLTDPVKGGLKTDLTPLMESSTSTNLATALGAAAPYFPSAGSAAGHGSPTWDYLRSHYQLYRRVTAAASTKPRFRATSADLAPKTLGHQTKPSRASLVPVIAKLQIMFSLVSHHSHIGDRVSAFNSFAVPQGNNNHAVPHLVYDPVVTLYNPYDVELELPQLRVRISDPPVGFQFMKHDKAAGRDSWYRPEFENGEFHGLGRFQIANETNKDARKFFTLFLRNRTASGTPGGNIVLMPGEVKVFSAYVERNWTWGLETSGGYTPRAFFDWNVSNNLGERDNRSGNKMGVDGLPGLDFRAGLQTDHMSYSARPPATLYPWEKAPLNGGWVSLKLTDDVSVNAKTLRTVNNSTMPDFRVDLLAGVIENPDADRLRSYEFRFADITKELNSNISSGNIISRRFNNATILQKPADTTPGGKSPFAIFTMTAKTTRDARDDSKSWAFNNMVTEGGIHDSRTIGNAAQSYDLRLDEIQDFTTFPGIEYDDANKRGYFGAMATANLGVSIVPMHRTPLIPAASLGDWTASNLVVSSLHPRVNHALGNSFAHPLIPSDAIETANPSQPGSKMLDHTYLLNAALWDSCYFSSATHYNSAVFTSNRTKSQVLEDFFSGSEPMLNPRLVPLPSAERDDKALARKFASDSDIVFAKTFAGNVAVNGAFNVNSDSVDSWHALLASLRDAAVRGYGGMTYQNDSRSAFVRAGLPVASSADDANPASSVNALGQIRWAGFRSLTDNQLRDLAKNIVGEIRERGKTDKAPSLCLADFINRRLGAPGGLHALKGIVQTAIDRSGINDSFHNEDSNMVSSSSLPADRTRGLANPQALDGRTADGAPPMLTQADLLAAIAPVITARGDTFTIRAYGESRSADGTKVEAKAYCEATVQRMPEFIDPANAPETATASLNPANKAFGRRMVITSFRWLNPSEI